MSKIRIRPFRSVSVDPEYVEKTWALLEHAIVQIQERNESELSFEELYRNAYNLVLHKHGTVLYKGLVNTISRHMITLKRRIESAMQNKFLFTVNKIWEEHLTSMLMIRDILLYMDRTYLADEYNESVFDIGLAAFRDQVINTRRIRDHLQTTLLHLVHQERTGEFIERGEVKNACKMLVTLGINSRHVYEDIFQNPFLEQSAYFYRRESHQFLTEHDASVYLRKAEARLEEELARVKHCLDPATEPLIVDTVEAELITKHLREIIDMDNSGLVHMLQHNKFDDLRRMYQLLARVPGGLDLMRQRTQETLQATGRALVLEEEESVSKASSKFVKNLLNLKDTYDKHWSQAFQSDRSFQQAINNAFSSFVNLNTKAPEFVSLFIDETLRKGIKEMSEAELERVLNNTMTIFRYIQEKDIFERYYKQHLAKRLLLNKTVSDEAERGVLSRLKVECGYNFTSKLEGMFTDISTSRTTMADYQQYLNQLERPNPIDFQVRVLTTVYWPTHQPPAVILPAELNDVCQSFERFYLSRHNGRKLTWQPALGSGDLAARFEKKRHTLTVSTYQMILLLLFNELGPGESISYEELKGRTNLPDAEVKRGLHALVFGKSKILLKENNNRDIEGENFQVNTGFSSKMTRIKIQQVLSKENTAERLATRAKVDEDRVHQIEACVVRIMKARKNLHHSNLVAEVTEHLQPRFVPHPNNIKRRIESLIERDYLGRSTTDRKMYHYIA
eukprot:m.174938 g.174938  ORF g.174938 m.174938 type:complete len:733 (+) comp25290_c1_seq1:50-2248(+)